MKKIMVCLLLSVLCSLPSVQAGTNDYNATLTGMQIEARLAAITNLQAGVSNLTAFAAVTSNVTFSAGLADVGFVSMNVMTAFTNNSFTQIDLKTFVGTNAALVVLEAQAAALSTVAVRRAGNTNVIDATSNTRNVISANESSYFIIDTDSAGAIEATASGSTTFKLVAFIRRHVFQ